jgi:two-component system sensor histidine kinase BaeS
VRRLGVRPYLFVTAALSIAVGLGVLAWSVQRTASHQLTGYIRSHDLAVARRVATTLASLYATRGFPGMELGAQHFADLLDTRLVIRTRRATLVFVPPGSTGGPVHIRPVSAVLPRDLVGTSMRLELYGPPALTPRLSPVLRAIERRLLWASIAAFLTALALSAVVGEWLVRPVKRIAQGVRQLAAGDLGHQVPVGGPAEIAHLGEDFNRMADALHRSEQSRRQMVADVAHELRTPLSILIGYLEALRDGAVPEGADALAVATAQAQHLNRLVQDLQDLALADAGELTLARRLVDLAALADRVRSDWDLEAARRGLTLTFEGARQGLPVWGDDERLRQALGNYVANALRYTPAGGRVTVRTRQEAGWARVEVADTGPGIAPEDLPRVFDRFYRVDRSRSAETGGSGLGLAIVQRLVERQGGRVGVHSRPGEGTVFWLELPVAAGVTAESP